MINIENDSYNSSTNRKEVVVMKYEKNFNNVVSIEMHIFFEKLSLLFYRTMKRIRKNLE